MTDDARPLSLLSIHERKREKKIEKGASIARFCDNNKSLDIRVSKGLKKC